MRLWTQLLLGSALLAPFQASAACPFDPARDFFANFDNDCYAITPITGAGGDAYAGDLHADYDAFWFHTDPNYELIIYGDYPRTRYFAVTSYDDHSIALSSLYDAQITPLTPADNNPYMPGAQWSPGQRWAVVLSLGGPTPSEPSMQQGCSLADLQIRSNLLQGYGRHTGNDWTGDPDLPRSFPAHNPAPMLGGAIIVRRYLVDRSQPAPVKVLVRDVRTGCVMAASDALKDHISLNPILRKDWGGDSEQSDAHRKYATKVQQAMCYGPNTGDAFYWNRNTEFIKGNNAEAAYLVAPMPKEVSSAIKSLFSKKYLRMRVRLPVTPDLPCAFCTRTGNETLRYWSLSFMDGTHTLYSLSDNQVVRDPNGFATIVVGVGDPPPQISAAHGYTYVNAASGPLNGFGVTSLVLRSILPAPAAACVANNIPFRYSEHNGAGGFMGEYSFKSDVLAAEELPELATVVREADSCGLPPPEIPQACSAYYPSGLSGLSSILP